ncbi:DUF1801 domain-containing protein [Castellaniella sp.]|uniref:DUF1801 domain-containing protein n=1 Tax=Castellaniella sp. TaxID=1955812 RepID=UPI003C753AB3
MDLKTKKPPVPADTHDEVDRWIAGVMPAMNSVVSALDHLIRDHLKDARFAIKWGKAYYGCPQFGWCIELAAYHVSVNVVFLNGDKLHKPPVLGDASRYVKIKSLEELESAQLLAWIKESCGMPGWRAD